MRRALSAFTMLLLVPAMAGCTAGGVTRLEAIPDELAAVTDPLETVPAAAWNSDGDAWFVLTFGSSSCPTEPTKVTQEDDRHFAITLSKHWWPLCTADQGPAAFRIDSPIPRDDSPVTIDLGPGIIIVTL